MFLAPGGLRPGMRAIKPLLLTLGLFLGLVGCDHATKRGAERALRGHEPVPIVAGAVDLQYRENRGVAFNLERVLPEAVRKPLLLLAAFGVLAAIAVAWWRRRAEVSAVTAGYA